MGKLLYILVYKNAQLHYGVTKAFFILLKFILQNTVKYLTIAKLNNKNFPWNLLFKLKYCSTV
jgi:hypothetical protein